MSDQANWEEGMLARDASSAAEGAGASVPGALRGAWAVPLLSIVVACEIIVLLVLGLRGGMQPVNSAGGGYHGGASYEPGIPTPSRTSRVGDPALGTAVSIPLLRNVIPPKGVPLAVLVLGVCADCSADILRTWQAMSGEAPGARFCVIVEDVDTTRVNRLAEQVGITIPVFLDLDGRASMELNAFFFPRAYVIRDGMIEYVQEPDLPFELCIRQVEGVLTASNVAHRTAAQGQLNND